MTSVFNASVGCTASQFDRLIGGREYAFAGRAAAAIYLVLECERVRGMEVVVPANICYAAVVPVLYSGNQPRFVDVTHDGNLRFEDVVSACTNRTAAIVVPHMYGNPCQEIRKIAAWCSQHNVLLLEDCASAMGATVDGQPAGSFGDYSIYSFGYAKTIDLGYGCLLTSPRELSTVRRASQTLPVFDERVCTDIQLLSDVYRVLRRREDHAFTLLAYRDIPEAFRGAFLFRATESQCVRMRDAIESLNDIVQLRRQRVRLYDQQIKYGGCLSRYEFREGSAPWRFNLMVDPVQKRKVVCALLESHVPVSDWYPNIGPFFGIHEAFPRTDGMAARILNFPLLGLESDEIGRICGVLNQFTSAHGAQHESGT